MCSIRSPYFHFSSFFVIYLPEKEREKYFSNASMILSCTRTANRSHAGCGCDTSNRSKAKAADIFRLLRASVCVPSSFAALFAPFAVSLNTTMMSVGSARHDTRSDTGDNTENTITFHRLSPDSMDFLRLPGQNKNLVAFHSFKKLYITSLFHFRFLVIVCTFGVLKNSIK